MGSYIPDDAIDHILSSTHDIRDIPDEAGDNLKYALQVYIGINKTGQFLGRINMFFFTDEIFHDFQMVKIVT
jgi:hypothetical protein